MRLVRVSALFFVLVLLASGSAVLFGSLAFDVAAQVGSPPSWEYSPLTPRVGDVVSFDASLAQQWLEDANSTSYLQWSFGDGATATGLPATHVYASPGVYLVELTVMSDLGAGASSGMYVEVREQTPVTVFISLSSGRIYTGQEVTIGGNLTFDGAGVPDAWVSLSSKTYIEGDTWKNIATVKTDASGRFSAVWKPKFGAYQINATWAGNSSYPKSTTSVNLWVSGFGNFVTEFSSNSTVTGLNFNASTRVLSFSAEGPSGTFGYTKITLEKDPTFDPEGISVLLDGNPINYTVDSTDQSWIVGIAYAHSIHHVTVDFNADEVPEISSVVAVAAIMGLTTVVAFYFKRRHRALT